MTDYGLTPAGFVRKPLDVILSEIESDQKASLGPDTDMSPELPLGQLNGIQARQLGIGWEQLETLSNANDPDAAEGRLLEAVCKITGTFRARGTATEVDLVCDLDIGTELVADTHLAAIDTKPDVQFTPKANFTSLANGMHTVRFKCTTTGPVTADAGSITVIKTSLVGWNSVNNPSDATPGREVMTDTELRIRREQDIAATGSTTIAAIAANLSTAFTDQITALTVFENDGDTTDGAGRPPHTVEALIDDGNAIDNDDIAQVILDSKAGGVGTYGTTSGTATEIVNGISVTKTINFSRPSDQDIYIELSLTTVAGYAGDAAVKSYIANTANAFFKPDDDVVALVVRSLPLAVAGVKDVTAFTIGTAPSPVTDTNIAIGLRQRARFNTARIIIT